jgi:hypothetical protein
MAALAQPVHELRTDKPSSPHDYNFPLFIQDVLTSFTFFGEREGESRPRLDIMRLQAGETTCNTSHYIGRAIAAAVQLIYGIYPACPIIIPIFADEPTGANFPIRVLCRLSLNFPAFIEEFYFDSGRLCMPNNPAFEAWFTKIPYKSASPVFCKNNYYLPVVTH